MVNKKEFMNHSSNGGSQEQENQSWRKEANNRILQHRQRELVINVINKEQKPVAGIEVEIKQIRHEFAFGSAMNDQVLFNQTYADFLFNILIGLCLKMRQNGMQMSLKEGK